MEAGGAPVPPSRAEQTRRPIHHVFRRTAGVFSIDSFAMPTAVKNAHESKRRQKKRGDKPKKPKLADTADRHDLYQRSVQSVEDEVAFIDERFGEIRGRELVSVREDFCGTAAMACAWAAHGPTKRAVGVDIDPEVLGWGREHNVAALPEEARRRVTLIEGDVFTVRTEPVDAVVAMNFSYWLFMERAKLLDYFRSLHRALRPDGLLFLDAYGGYEAHQVIEEERECDGFTYVWDQADFDPITHRMQCYIHFLFPDKSKMKKAFSYVWRLWSLPELKELLLGAGFTEVQFWWEGADEDGEGTGEFERVERGDADAGWICYLIALK